MHLPCCHSTQQNVDLWQELPRSFQCTCQNHEAEIKEHISNIDEKEEHTKQHKMIETKPEPGNRLPREVEDCQYVVGSSHKLHYNAPMPAYSSPLCSFDEQGPGALHHQLQQQKIKARQCRTFKKSPLDP